MRSASCSSAEAEHAARLEACACFGIRRAARAIARAYDAALAPAGIDSSTFALLSALAGEPRVPFGDLAAHLLMDRTTLTRVLRTAATRGFVIVEAGADRRRRIVALSARGRATLKKAFPHWRRAQRHITGTVGPARWLATLDGIERTVAAAQAL